jgi:hypothetical protein
VIELTTKNLTIAKIVLGQVCYYQDFIKYSIWRSSLLPKTRHTKDPFKLYDPKCVTYMQRANTDTTTHTILNQLAITVCIKSRNVIHAPKNGRINTGPHKPSSTFNLNTNGTIKQSLKLTGPIIPMIKEWLPSSPTQNNPTILMRNTALGANKKKNHRTTLHLRVSHCLIGTDFPRNDTQSNQQIHYTQLHTILGLIALLR